MVLLCILPAIHQLYWCTFMDKKLIVLWCSLIFIDVHIFCIHSSMVFIDFTGFSQLLINLQLSCGFVSSYVGWPIDSGSPRTWNTNGWQRHTRCRGGMVTLFAGFTIKKIEGYTVYWVNVSWVVQYFFYNTIQLYVYICKYDLPCKPAKNGVLNLNTRHMCSCVQCLFGNSLDIKRVHQCSSRGVKGVVMKLS